MNAETTPTGSESPTAETDETGTDPRFEDAALRVRDLRKTYGSGDDAVTAVDGISLDVERGSVVGLLGPNGAGKTTTIKSMLGLVVPTEGSVRIAGVDVHESPKAAYRRVGAMLEGARNVYWRLTVRENLAFFAALAGDRPSDKRERHGALLEQFGLAEKADVTVKELSRGMKQKVSLACTLARDADVAFLDEPTLGLDVESSLELRTELRDLAEESGTTIVLSSHDMDVIEDLCDRVVIMNEGRIVADDTVENLLDLFRTQTYEVRVEGEIPPDARRRLEGAFDAAEFERRSDVERFVVSVTGGEFYDLTDALRDAGLALASVDAVEPDLEDVFLELTDDSGDDSGGDRA
ncbi:ABC transporter ATP-binding protein [Halorussus sp. GCM10023401]|uniref:ABC transporter ATP-binding protein n=1 Tax=Halorussus TaxID=1070314 RepID=UPI0020A19CFC|nr:ABC transporter ATP-binding protein [Halorussus vallis]USZ75597.1 ABC transporter ATP-binding protein [Halorussus vallis]